jgi:hypothetical protein
MEESVRASRVLSEAAAAGIARAVAELPRSAMALRKVLATSMVVVEDDVVGCCKHFVSSFVRSLANLHQPERQIVIHVKGVTKVW